MCVVLLFAKTVYLASDYIRAIRYNIFTQRIIQRFITARLVVVTTLFQSDGVEVQCTLTLMVRSYLCLDNS